MILKSNKNLYKKWLAIQIITTIISIVCVVLLAYFLQKGNSLFLYVSLAVAIGVNSFFGIFECIRFFGRLQRFDLFTGLNNTNGLSDFIEKIQHKNNLDKYICLYMDIKSLKLINKKFGFQTGDEIIKSYGKILSQFVTKEECATRLFGDTFFVVIKKERLENFLMIIATIKMSVTDEDGSVKEMEIDSHCGIYQLKPDDDLNKMLTNSSTALKNAKNSPFGEFVIYRDDMMEVLLNEKETSLLFPEAIKNHDFKIYYQPKVDLNSNTLCGCEALVRWIKDGIIVPPDSFIPVLEKEGSVVDLDFYVFEQVCSDLSHWKNMGKSPVKVSVNFSKLHLKDENFGNKILKILQKYNIEPGLIEIEITESSGYDDFESLEEFVDIMNDHNISTSIDDFGTGYSSLSLIKDLNVSVIKLDKSLINHIDESDEKNEIMIKNIVKMIKDLGRDVICEGVETKKQADYLKSVNCNVVQGFLCDKPLTHDEFESKLDCPDYNFS